MDYALRIVVEKVAVGSQEVIKRDTITSYDIQCPTSIGLTFRTLFHTSEAILEEPPAERGEGTIYRLCHTLQPIAATLLSS